MPAKEWFEKAYPKANQRAYDGDLPYQLYPPDAAPGKKPTPDSPLAIAVKRGVSRGGRWPWGAFNGAYTNEFAHGRSGNVGETGVEGVQRQQGLQATGWLGKATFDALNWALVPAGLANAGQPLFDVAAVRLIKQAAEVGPPPTPNTKIPDLGPVVPNGRSVLVQDLTHMTGGLEPDYPAFDDGWAAGVKVIAPEPLTVTRQSSAVRRDGNPNGKAFYATGASGILYWFGHTDVAPAVGAKFAKGATMCTISPNHEQPHLHVGIDAKPIGVALKWGRDGNGPDYTHCPVTVGEQLAQALA